MYCFSLLRIISHSVDRALINNATYRFSIAPIPFRTTRVNHVTARQEVPWGYRYFSWLWSFVDFGNVGSGGREDSFRTNALRTNKCVCLKWNDIEELGPGWDNIPVVLKTQTGVYLQIL